MRGGAEPAHVQAGRRDRSGVTSPRLRTSMPLSTGFPLRCPGNSRIGAAGNDDLGGGSSTDVKAPYYRRIAMGVGVVG